MSVASSVIDRWDIVRHVVIEVATRRELEFVDVTAQLADTASDCGLIEGVLVVQSRHTTAGLMINEHEPLLLADLAAMFERLAPASGPYAHDDFARRPDTAFGERTNGHAHCRAALLRTSEYLPVTAGVLNLGRWQRVFLVDFDGPQTRQLWVTLLGQGTHPLRRLV